MTRERTASGASALGSALEGAALGATYACVEGVCADLLAPLIDGTQASLRLAACALAASALLGGVCASLARQRGGARAETPAATTIAMFLGLHAALVASRFDDKLIWAYSFGLSLTLFACAALVATRAVPRWLRSLARPVPAFAIAVVVPWLAQRLSGPPRLASALGLPLLGGALALAVPLVNASLWVRLALSLGVATALPLLGAVATIRAPHTSEPPAAPPSQPMPTVILVSLDTVRADHLSAYGYAADTTPNLRAFAAHATRFTRHTSSSDMTLPSHASMFTGLYPRSHGAHFLPTRAENAAPLSPNLTTLAERLAAAGYRTAGFAANHAYLSAQYGLNRGFQHWDDRRASAWLRSESPLLLRAWLVAALRPILPLRASEVQFRNATVITDAVLSHVERFGADEAERPWLLFVNYMDAHWPYLPPPRFRAVSGNVRETLRTHEYLQLELQVSKREREIRPEERAELIARYDASIAYIDAELARLLAGLAGKLDLERAVVVITSDHGEAFGERGFIGHAVSAQQDQIHTPLLLRLPGQQAGHVDDRLASGVDLTPTILDALDLPPQPGVHGVSLLEPAAARQILAESYGDPFRGGRHARFERMEWALFEGEDKLIASTRARSRLFEPRLDPDELDDRAPTEGERVLSLERALGAWRRATPNAREAAVPLDAELEARLRALGYVN